MVVRISRLSILRRERFQKAACVAQGARVDFEHPPPCSFDPRIAVRAAAQSNDSRIDVDIREYRRGERAQERSRVRKIPRLRLSFDLGIGVPPHCSARCPSDPRHRLQLDPRPSDRRKKNATRSHRQTHTIEAPFPKTQCPKARAGSDQLTARSGQQRSPVAGQITSTHSNQDRAPPAPAVPQCARHCGAPGLH